MTTIAHLREAKVILSANKTQRHIRSLKLSYILCSTQKNPVERREQILSFWVG